MSHISDGQEFDTPYAHAVHQRDTEVRNTFMEGLRRQRQHDSELLRTYRTQRDDARSLCSLYEFQLEKAKEQIAQLRKELLELRITHDQLRSHTWPEGSNRLVHEDLGFLTPASFGSHERDPPDLTDDENGNSPFGVELEDSSGSLDIGNKKPGDVGVSVKEGTNDSRYQTDSPMESWDHLSLLTTNQADDPSTISSPKTVAQNESGRATALSSGLASDLHILLNLDRQVGLSPEPLPSIAQPEQGAASLKEILEQMKLSHHPDNKDILPRARPLVSEAHETPAWHRTESQVVLPSEWRAPSPSFGPSSDVEAPPVEFYVDASCVGIGFVFENQWQAWELKAGWKGGRRDINWAEAAAVELGLCLMIQAGYSGRRLLVRSDNAGVVEAVSKRLLNDVHAGRSVELIDYLCPQHHVSLEIKWIAGEDNPADSPSRLKTGKGSLRFPHDIAIPVHFQDFIFPYVG